MRLSDVVITRRIQNCIALYNLNHAACQPFSAYSKSCRASPDPSSASDAGIDDVAIDPIGVSASSSDTLLGAHAQSL
jgi:hypothetical protein